MPYIEPHAKEAINPHIMNLHKKILERVEKSKRPDCIAWPYMRYVAMKVVEETGLNAAEQYKGRRAMRYFLIADQSGIILNIIFELLDEVYSKMPEQPDGGVVNLPVGIEAATYPLPEDVSLLLDPDIQKLLDVIAEIAGPTGYNYPEAYKGLVNYSMSELMPRVLKSAYDTISKKFCWPDVLMLMEFWIDVAREFYNPKIARPYEDAQKRKFGNVKIFQDMLQWLQE